MMLETFNVWERRLRPYLEVIATEGGKISLPRYSISGATFEKLEEDKDDRVYEEITRKMRDAVENNLEFVEL